MSNPDIDEADLSAKFVLSLIEFARRYGHPPGSTVILFEPHHGSWGIYHSLRQMSRDDSPGDYEIQNAAVGGISVPDPDYARADFESVLYRIADRLVSALSESLRPETLAIELDYDRIYTLGPPAAGPMAT